MIISASRRTDIPAFYADWFAARLQAGFAKLRNPFNPHQVKQVSLAAEDVDAVVFWTRNFTPMLRHLPLLDGLGHAYYVHITITHYPRNLERATPKPQAALDGFTRLADLIGPDRVIWRYDPILICNQIEIDDHKRGFAHIAGALAGSTRLCVISFADFYKKTERNLRAIAGFQRRDPSPLEYADLIGFMSDCAAKSGIRLQSCSEPPEITRLGGRAGKCIDDDLLRRVFGCKVKPAKDKGQRGECGCVKSIDVGAYDTCRHGCAYCYAVADHDKAALRWAKHDPMGEFLIP